MVTVLQFNDKQLSIFDFKQATKSRKELVQRVNRALGLDELPNQSEMIDRCLQNPEVFSYEQRLFLRSCCLAEFDEKQMSDKQMGFLENLYRRSFSSQASRSPQPASRIPKGAS